MTVEETKEMYQRAKQAFASQRYEEVVELCKKVALLGFGLVVGKPLQTLTSVTQALELDDHMVHIVHFFEDQASLIASNASKCLRYAKELLVYVESNSLNTT